MYLLGGTINPSHQWQSILWGRGILDNGVMWRIGDGQAIKVRHGFLNVVQHRQAPSGDMLKMNVDGAISGTSMKVGVGGVIHNQWRKSQ